MKTVCLDPGHGPTTVNGSPDGTYKEQEFAWDLYTRLRPLLERQGVRVVVTRGQSNKPSLTERANTSNQAGADLFLSLHTNAAGGSGWSSPRGFIAYTSGAGNAPRNTAAQAIIQEAKRAGVTLRGNGLAHGDYTVLNKTKAPAVLIEYGFHTNREDVALLKTDAYRDKLATITAKGACQFLGIPWNGEKEDDMTEDQVKKLIDKALVERDEAAIKAAQTVSPWAKEAWDKVVAAGVFDGTRPGASLTREQAAVVLARLEALEK